MNIQQPKRKRLVISHARMPLQNVKAAALRRTESANPAHLAVARQDYGFIPPRPMSRC
jgi:hypothetical protein